MFFTGPLARNNVGARIWSFKGDDPLPPEQKKTERKRGSILDPM